MKPIYLEINNFGPHAHSVIDFRKLDESPIFLIGGDTGAGKSTIFDAMTYALFNTTTSDRDAREMRSQFASPKDITKVIFYFEQSGKIYKIERTPLQVLAKERGTGNTTRNPTANLSVVEDVGDIEIESIATKPADVGIAIAEILNLNADQFKKIILLPQNDFSEFLKSNTYDKEKILKKIFGTQLFTDFTAKLKDHFDAANAKSTDFNNELKSQTESPVWTDEEHVELAKTTNDQLLAILQNYLEQRQNKLAATQASEKKIDAEYEAADNKYRVAETIKNNFERLAELEQEYQAKITDQSQDIKLKQVHVDELTWAQPLRETVRDLDKITIEQQESTKDEQTVTQKLTTSKKEFDLSKEIFTKFNSQIKDFENKNEQVQKLSVTIAKVQDIENIKRLLAQLKPQLEEAQHNLADKTETAEKIKQSIETKKRSAIDSEILNEQKDNLNTEKNNLTDTLNPLANKRDTNVSEAQKLQERLKKLTIEAETKKATLAKAKEVYQEKIKTRQTLMIAQLRQELETGQPCAVCGSTEHPYSELTVTADENGLRKSMKEVDDSQKAYAAADNAVKEINQTLDELSAEFSQKQQESVEAFKSLSAKYSELLEKVSLDLPTEFNMEKIREQFQIKLDEINQKLKDAQKLNQEIKTLEQQSQDIQTELISANAILERLLAQQQTHTNDLDSKLKALDNPDVSSNELIQQQSQLKLDYNEFQTNLKRAQESLNLAEKTFSNNQTHLDDIKNRLKKQDVTIKNLSEKLNQALSSEAAKTNDYDTLDKWIHELNQNQLTELQNIIVSYNKEKEMLTTNINKLKQEIDGLEKPDTDKLKQALDEVQLQRKSIISQVATAKTDFTNAQKSFDKVTDIMKQQGSFAKELAAITSLYNVVNGKDGNDSKLKLETYVVQNYLQRILSYANETFLNRLSHNRYYFVISEKAVDKQRDHGLDINVYDRETNAIRSSDTLSGGETFIAALSIALSLSEVVQSSANGVQIDALFVDEGFGSLDDETLSEAMNALEDIGKNRMVGVISHIESMKQSIGQQLLVKKLGDGKSEIELINK
ncbi:AAA family ATPase [Companilactobacillus huachuanensis]|uniref:Nuclease SbcCD subunit C n=1 Tax=Companilactobacillus huachuanensis TaxID=2559914 RepID=A0ABW1RKK5_9LACO|nr:SMC family ATPase [Companilactobacillus huachuanensis]